jgi:translation initiation factor 2 beta subunit (eIF-2beta)/eIF-5
MGKILAAYGGGFKPPTGGHFEIVKRALQEFPEIDEFTVFVGGKVRDGIEQEEAILVWDIYKSYLANKVNIQPSKSPIGDILRLAKNNPQDVIYFVIGYREGRQDDLDDVSSRTGDLEKKYPNIVVKVIPTYNPNMSGTNARKALNKSEEEFIKFLPNEVEEKSEIYSILRPSVAEILKENSTYSKSIDLQSILIALTKHMLDMGLNISPLPSVEFIEGDTENASNFFGKTAYYDPNNNTIALFTEGRHPKDIARSFAHEMIHHIQNLEGRLGNIKTTNTNEDEDLDAIEREAYQEGNMIFRNWTDSLDGDIRSSINEAIVGEKIECDNCGWDWNIVDGGNDLFICHKCGHDNELLSENKDYFGLNKFIKEVAEEVLKEGKYDSLVTKLAGFTLNAWKGDFEDGESKGYFELEVGPGREFDYPHLFFDYKAKASFVDDFMGAGLARPMKKMPEVELNYRIPLDELPRMWEQISMDIRNTIRHEIEHLMQSGPNVKKGKEMEPDRAERDEINKISKKPWWKIWRKALGTPDYYKLEKEIDANLEGLYLQAKKSRKPLEQVIDNYLKFTLNLNPEDRADIKALWKKRAPKLNIPVNEDLEKIRTKYKIFSDMDGVITDFDNRFKKYSKGIAPSDYEKKYGKDKFWELADQPGIAFWVGMPWMEDGKNYWDYIKDYDVELLSSPSRSQVSRLGKRLWVRNNLPGIKLTLAQARNKQNYAAPNHILIDDRKSNIDQWISQGGIGILHTSASDTIKQLKKLGL